MHTYIIQILLILSYRLAQSILNNILGHLAGSRLPLPFPINACRWHRTSLLIRGGQLLVAEFIVLRMICERVRKHQPQRTEQRSQWNDLPNPVTRPSYISCRFPRRPAAARQPPSAWACPAWSCRHWWPFAGSADDRNRAIILERTSNPPTRDITDYVPRSSFAPAAKYAPQLCPCRSAGTRWPVWSGRADGRGPWPAGRPLDSNRNHRKSPVIRRKKNPI